MTQRKIKGKISKKGDNDRGRRSFKQETERSRNELKFQKEKARCTAEVMALSSQVTQICMRGTWPKGIQLEGEEHSGSEEGFCIRNIWVCILVLSPPTCMNWGTLLH